MLPPSHGGAFLFSDWNRYANLPFWTGGVAAPKVQTGWWFRFEMQNPSIKNYHPVRSTRGGFATFS
jgi:hypothetical protein